MKARVTVLYEDRRGPQKRFGPHELVVAMVADAIGKPAHEVSRIVEARPAKSNNKLRNWCRSEADRIAADCHPIVAVFDSDRVDRLEGLQGLSGNDVEKKVRTESATPDKIHPRLLERNLESVAEALRELAPRLVDEKSFERVLAKKSLMDRDLLFGRAASADEQLRNGIREKVPSLGRIADTIVSLFGLEPRDV